MLLFVCIVVWIVNLFIWWASPKTFCLLRDPSVFCDFVECGWKKQNRLKSNFNRFFGGRWRIRTADPLLVRQMLWTSWAKRPYELFLICECKVSAFFWICKIFSKKIAKNCNKYIGVVSLQYDFRGESFYAEYNVRVCEDFDVFCSMKDNEIFLRWK